MAMQQQENLPLHSAKATKIYNRILERARLALATRDQKTWGAVREEVDRAVEREAEAEAEELTREELDLLKAYVHRDLKDLSHYMEDTGESVTEWLKIDLALIETEIKDLLLSIADKTTVEQVELDQRLHHEPGTYMAGEIACAGMLYCLDCGHMVCLTETSHIEPCHRCFNHYFKRVTSRWPRDPEIEREVPDTP
jgi:hypothetical protein